MDEVVVSTTIIQFIHEQWCNYVELFVSTYIFTEKWEYAVYIDQYDCDVMRKMILWKYSSCMRMWVIVFGWKDAVLNNLYILLSEFI